ncbi:retention module-containing protein [Campylobacter concisus]|uniref:retention module-containing protein n=2 Tax=Campylobacter concisus TaxID=199 RepID=UPI000D32265F|nr:retention module-containing protein [Campylobacter concisus]
MAKEAGVVKSVNGGIARALNDLTGEVRQLSVGDIVYQGEKIVTEGSNSKVTITQTDGKDITLIGKDTLTLDQDSNNNETVADISALQQAILKGTDLNALEETAAGGPQAGGNGGDGVSLSSTSFAEGGHISNIYANYGNLPDNGGSYISDYSAIRGGGLDTQDATNTIIPPTPTVKFTEDENGDHLLNKDENNIDGDQNKTTVRITVPNDGSVEIGDTLNIVIYKPNGSSESRQVPITQQIIDNGHVLTDVPVENDKNSVVTATITNKYGNTGGEGRDTITTDTIAPTTPTVEFTKDANNDGFLNKSENEANEDPNTTPVKITVPADANVGDTLEITITKPDDTTQNITKTITPEIKNNGYVIPDVPVENGKTSTVSAYITDQAGNKGGEGRDTITTDTTAEAPIVTFVEDKNAKDTPNPKHNPTNPDDTSDGILNNPENASDGKIDTSKVEIKFPGDVTAGDKLNITIKDPTSPSPTTQKITITQAMIDNGNKYSLDVPVRNGQTSRVDATITDKVENTSKSAYDEVKLVSDKPKPPVVEFTEDVDNNGILSREENGARDTSPVKITIPDQTNLLESEKVKVGDILNIKISGGGNNETFNVKITQEILDDLKGNGFMLNGSNSFENIKSDGSTETVTPNPKVRNFDQTIVTATITNEYGNASDQGKDYVTPKVAPRVTFTEDSNNNGMLNFYENRSGDSNLKTTTAKIELPYGVKAADDYLKFDITTDITSNIKLKLSDLSDTTETPIASGITATISADKQSITLKGVPVSRDFKTTIENAVVLEKDGSTKKSDVSNKDEVIVEKEGIYVEFAEKQSVKVDGGDNALSRSDSMKDGKVNEIDAIISIPKNVRDGDILKLEIKDPIKETTETREYTIHTDTKGFLNSITSNNPSNYPDLESKFPSAQPTSNQKYEYILKGVGLEAGEKTTVKATLDYRKGTNDDAVTTDVSKEATTQIENIKAPEVIFEDAKGGTSVSRNDARKNTNGDYLTDVTIKIPSNAVNGDKVKVTIKDPNGNATETTYIIHKLNKKGEDASKSSKISKITEDKNSNNVMELSSDKKGFVIKDVLMKTGEKTEVTAKVLSAATHNGVAVDESTEAKATVTVSNLNRVSIAFDKDDNENSLLSRPESASGGNLAIYKTTAKITLPNNILEKDKVTIDIDGTQKDYIVEKDSNGNLFLSKGSEKLEIKDGAVTIKDIELKTSGDTKISVSVTDKNGAVAEAKNNISMDTLNNDMLIKFDEDKNNDGVIATTANETTASIKLPSNTVNGDILKLKIGDNSEKSYLIEKNANGKFEITEIDSAKNKIGTPIEADDNKIVKVSVPINSVSPTKVSAEVVDYEGKGVAVHSTNDIKKASGGGNSLMVTYEEDTNRDAKLSRAEANQDGTASKTNAVITLPVGKIVTGDKLTVDIKNEPSEPSGNRKLEYILTKNNDGSISAVDKNGNPVNIEEGLIKVPVNVQVGTQTTTKVTLEDSTGVNKGTTGEKPIELERGLNDKPIKVTFDEDNLNRDGTIDRVEADEDGNIYTTTATVTIPYNASIGDKLKVEISTESTPREYELKSVDGKIKAVSSSGETLDVVDNAIKIPNVKLAYTAPTSGNPAPALVPTTVKATLTDAYGEDKTIDNKNINLNMGFSGKLEAVFTEDLSRNKVLSRDEAAIDGNAGKTTLGLKLPSNVMAGDKISVTIKTDGQVTRTENFTLEKENGELVAKSANGNKISLEGGALNLKDIDVSVGHKYSAEAELTNSKGEYKQTSTNEVELEKMQYISSYSESEDASNKGLHNVTLYLPEDAREGDKISLTYTDPNDHSKTVMKELEGLTKADIDNGHISTQINVNPEKAYDVKVVAQTADSSGSNHSVASSFTIKVEQDISNDTVEFNANNNRMYGGNGTDTLVFKESVDLNNVANLGDKVYKFEQIKLGDDGANGAVNLTISPKNVLDITDNKDVRLKILGDDHDRVNLDNHEWKRTTDTNSGNRTYESMYEINGHTVKIEVDQKIHTDF